MYDSAKNIIDEVIDKTKLLETNDIPNIDLYMDQVTTYLNDKLEHLKRYPEDKLLTKTMINNYAKDGLLPPPVKKKYSKDHVIMLIMIYYFKNILSINDISKYLDRIKADYFQSDKDISLSDVYDTAASLENEKLINIKNDLQTLLNSTSNTFPDMEDSEEKDFLQLFTLISMLSYDVYVKRHLIEALIDGLLLNVPDKDDKKKDKKDKNN
ncbi:MAG: DUF1836 domain-containing protein [Eubacterium sp.]